MDRVDYGEAVPGSGTRMLVADIMHAELPEAYFDGIFVSNFLEHLPHPDAVYDFLTKMHALTAPGGRIAIMGPNFRYCAREYFDCADHSLALSHVSVAEHLYTAGFRVASVTPRFLPFSFRGRLPTAPTAGPRLPRLPARLAGDGQAVPGRRRTLERSSNLAAMARYGNEGLDHVAIGVADVERSRRFYAEVLGLERAHEAWDVPVVMAANGTGVAIFSRDLHPSAAPDGAEPPAIRILHIAFRVDREGLERARVELAERGLEVQLLRPRDQPLDLLRRPRRPPARAHDLRRLVPGEGPAFEAVCRTGPRAARGL